MKHIKQFEFFQDDTNTDLSLELEFKMRTADPTELKNKSMFDFLEDLGVKKGSIEGKEFGKILQNQMKYKKMSDEDFLKLYNDYKNKRV